MYIHTHASLPCATWPLHQCTGSPLHYRTHYNSNIPTFLVQSQRCQCHLSLSHLSDMSQVHSVQVQVLRWQVQVQVLAKFTSTSTSTEFQVQVRVQVPLYLYSQVRYIQIQASG